MIELSYFIAFLVVFFASIRLLHLSSRAEWPEIFANGSSLSEMIQSKLARENEWKNSFVDQILLYTPMLSKP